MTSKFPATERSVILAIVALLVAIFVFFAFIHPPIGRPMTAEEAFRADMQRHVPASPRYIHTARPPGRSR